MFGERVAMHAGQSGCITLGLLIDAPYFVPGQTGVSSFRALVRQGARVRLLTNSLMSNDVLAAQAGCTRYREALLHAGVELHELKPESLL